jgi:hypothetical protein
MRLFLLLKERKAERKDDMSLQEKLAELKRQALSEIEKTETPDKINEIRVHLLGEKGTNYRNFTGYA